MDILSQFIPLAIIVGCIVALASFIYKLFRDQGELKRQLIQYREQSIQQLIQHREQSIQEKEIDCILEFLVQLCIWHNKTIRIYKRDSDVEKLREAIEKLPEDPKINSGVILLSDDDFNKYHDSIFNSDSNKNDYELLHNLFSFIKTMIKKYRKENSDDVIEKKIKRLLNIKPNEDIRDYIK